MTLGGGGGIRVIVKKESLYELSQIRRTSFMRP